MSGPVALFVAALCIAFGASGARLNARQRDYLRRNKSPLLAYSAWWSKVGFLAAGVCAAAAAVWALIILVE